MKKLFYVLLFLVLSIIVFTFCSSKSSYTVGMTVAAKWTDGNYYLATITKIESGKYFVKYADGAEGEAKDYDLRNTAKKSDLSNGKKVIAVWVGSKFYSGTIKELKPSVAVISWDDGTADSEVEYDKIAIIGN